MFESDAFGDSGLDEASLGDDLLKDARGFPHDADEDFGFSEVVGSDDVRYGD